ncbi:DUF7857 domain-containing protein [Halegenticoccus soli]|uniref:DUF7857 domain-containing protein n=1 Tax=Halegenticoccus soli TaxID=1985678 RepID=UPI000C6D80AF|nr:hypothetical protein [Halegenticoccus soli]
MDLDWTIDSSAGVSLVSVRLRNPTPVDRRVRLRNRLDGPALPPRTEGVPEAGWDADGYETVVPAGERVVAGYACRAPPADPPVEVTLDERADEVDPPSPAPADAVRRLGRASPPRDAVPASASGPATRPAIDAPDATGSAVASDATGATETTGATNVTDTDDAEETEDAADAMDAERTTDATDGGAATDATTVPEPVASWFDDAEARIERAERLTDASVPEATAVMEAMNTESTVGGLDGIDRLAAGVATDADLLRSVAARATGLAERAEAADVPVDALRRLA